MPAVNEVTDLTLEGDVAVITLDSPPVNALSFNVRDGLFEGFKAAIADPAATAIVLICAGRTFIAGADISNLEEAAWGDPAKAIDLHDLLMWIEDVPKPIVMAIHGTALGGGLELAMAGRYRVAVPDALVGQPEVNLGIIPGAEGTQRLPRLVGVEKALEMCVTGKPIKAQEAWAAGLIDELSTGDLAQGASAFAGRVAQGPLAVKTRDRRERLGTAMR